MFLGGGVLVLAVAGGAWALFGRNGSSSDTSASIGPKVPSGTSAPRQPVGPVVASSTPAPTTATTPAPTKTATSPAPQPKPVTKPPVTQPPASKPPVTSPQQGGTVTKKAFTFKVARGDTLWDFTRTALRSTGRSTSNAAIAAHVAKLYSANRSLIGPDPNLILVGQTISWPAGL